MELWRLDATETASLVAKRDVSAREVLEAHVSRIAEVNPHVNAIVRDGSAEGLQTADRIDRDEITGSPHDPDQCLGHEPKAFVADEVAVLVIEALEMVDITDDE